MKFKIDINVAVGRACGRYKANWYAMMMMIIVG